MPRAAEQRARSPVSFLSDFGLDDDFVGVCHGVMRAIAPGLEIIDLTHGIPPHAVDRGARVLARGLPYLPVGVHLAVVDPGVGSARAAIALRTADGRVLVGPDNGLLAPAADAAGIVSARLLTNRRLQLDSRSHTFHARDVFAPVAAHLACGVAFEEVGDALDPALLVRIATTAAPPEGSALEARVVAVDHFGNLELDLTRSGLERLGLAPGGRVRLGLGSGTCQALVATTFADAAHGELVLYEGSYGAYEVAVRDGSAAAATATGLGDRVRICAQVD